MLAHRQRVALLSVVAVMTTVGMGVVMSATASAAATRYEAETAPATCDGFIESNHAGYSGSGFCNANNAVGAAAQFTVTATAAGTATLAIRYANGTTANRPADILVNGATALPGSAFNATGAWTTWATKTLTVSVNAGSNTIRLNPTTANGLPNVDYLEFDAAGTPPSSSPPSGTLRIRGGDVSSLKKNEDHGAVYYTSSGARADALQILRDNGMNWARLKVWVNPVDGYNNKARVLEIARRVKAQGMALLICFHYSDAWADPGKQIKPAAWRNYNFSQLRQAVYDHTYDILNGLKAQGTTADMAQIGNEINPGMLHPDGSTSNWANLAELLKAGVSAAKAVNSSTRIMLHLAEGGDNAAHRQWFDQATSRGVPFDVIGLSHYTYWHGTVSALQSNMNDLASRYNKDIVVVETAYGFTLANKDSTGNIFVSAHVDRAGYPATAQGQTDAFRAIARAVARVPNGRGLGYFYWEPAWTAVPGSGWDPTNPSTGNAWENQALFDFNSRPLPAMAVFRE
ncbi:glycosyl hydrolase 53 family protein [Allorhizocola rhizosphaerae]|uniref:glycosyl hydrolase 53 family protein n=1 Tax=Allorhizocola rhizosphaerae TaxID=1872709 RepID=UPI001FE934D4|nr:glycosyl hydrolase 53 family protein [Allorhizocola rhizosphaerae]